VVRCGGNKTFQPFPERFSWRSCSFRAHPRDIERFPWREPKSSECSITASSVQSLEAQNSIGNDTDRVVDQPSSENRPKNQ